MAAFGVPSTSGSYVFVSYVREDAVRVDRLAAVLRAAGVRVWLDTADLRPGQDWKMAIRAVIRDAQAVIVCFSAHSEAKVATYRNEELVLAVEELRRRRPSAYLREHFDAEAAAGIWTFLFDSFDEIPEILTSVEADDTVRRYERAIGEFLRAVGPCRGIVASREYRGPEHLHWPRFRLLELSDSRRRQLIRRSDVGDRTRETIETELPNAPAALRALAVNPMFLGLLCEYVERERDFPATTHAVFESYVDRRLAGLPGSPSDPARQQVRETAQAIAFCMTAEPGLGLRAEMEPLIDGLNRSGFSTGAERLLAVADALRAARLARWEQTSARLSGPPFTFTHRRFQEYFATCLVLAEPARVPPRTLLLDGQWREAAVTILQTRSADEAAPLVAQAQQFLDAAGERSDADEDRWDWPNGSLHVLSILDAGLVGRSTEDHRPLRDTVGRIVSAAGRRGLLIDQKWALDVIGPAPVEVFVDVLRRAFASGSGWLQDLAFWQAARVRPVPDAIYRQLVLGLLTASFTGRLWRNRRSIIARLRRADDPSLVRAAWVLAWLPTIDVGVHVLLAGLLGVLLARAAGGFDPGTMVPLLVFVLASVTGLHYLRAGPYFTWSVDGRRLLPPVRWMRSKTGMNPSFLLLFITLRVLLAILIVGLVWAASVWFVAAVWAITWAPSALYVARRARIRSPANWVLPQYGATVGLAAYLSRRWRRSRWASLGLLGLAAFTVVVVLFYDDLLPLVPTLPNATGSALALFLTTFALIGVIALVGFGTDARRYLKLQSKVPRQVSGPELVELVATRPSRFFMRRTLRLLRQTGALTRRPDAITVLRDLLELHKALLRDPQRHRSAPAAGAFHYAVRKWAAAPFDWPAVESPELAEWISAGGWRAEAQLHNLDPAIWDEIAMALDSLPQPSLRTDQQR